jgi:hypothetical protein
VEDWWEECDHKDTQEDEGRGESGRISVHLRTTVAWHAIIKYGGLWVGLVGQEDDVVGRLMSQAIDRVTVTLPSTKETLVAREALGSEAENGTSRHIEMIWKVAIHQDMSTSCAMYKGLDSTSDPEAHQ